VKVLLHGCLKLINFFIWSVCTCY
jgi:hypothetical protein